MIPITQKLIQVNTKRRSGQKLSGVSFLVSHDTANPERQLDRMLITS